MRVLVAALDALAANLPTVLGLVLLSVGAGMLAGLPVGLMVCGGVLLLDEALDGVLRAVRRGDT